MPTKFIQKIKLLNFKRFKSFEVDLDEKLNLFIGDNDSGKSSVLLAIDITLGGNRKKVEGIGLESLFNQDVITDFLTLDKAERSFKNLPRLQAELYLNEQENSDLNGEYNSDHTISDGLLFACEPQEDLVDEINEILQNDNPSFPFEYYSIIFKTFSGSSYTGYRKFLRHLLIDNTQISNEYATKSYIKTVYNSNAEEVEQNKHKYEYRKIKDTFNEASLKDLNDKLSEYSFAVKTDSKSNLSSDLTVSEGGVAVENMGKGKQCFIRTEFALTKSTTSKGLDVVLLEEPENHLSHGKMKELISSIQNATESQLFIATHNSLVSSRLDLRKSILLNSNSATPVLLDNLTEDTAKFFIKAPDNNILEFVLSKKVILVEGDAEFMLIGALFEKISGSTTEESGVHIISVGGTSFKRYLEIAKLLNIRTAVIRDNDKNYQVNCVDNYSAYNADDYLSIFSDTNDDRSTFEIAMYEDNTVICDEIFKPRTLSVQDFMLANKTRSAYDLLDKKENELVAPEYINQAITWINE